MAPAATLNARADLDIGDAGEADGVAGSLASARCSDVTRTTAMDTAEFEQRSVALDRARRAAHGDLGRLLDVSQRITQSLDASLALGERQSGVRDYHRRASRSYAECSAQLLALGRARVPVVGETARADEVRRL